MSHFDDPNKARAFMQTMNQMVEVSVAAEALNDDSLADELGMLGEDIRSWQCAVIGEVLFRWRHPIRSRVERFVKKVKRCLQP